MKRVDKASPKLLAEACAGKVTPSVILTVRNREAQMEFLKVTLQEVFISSLSEGGNGQTDTLPLEQLSLNFSKIEMVYMSDTGEMVEGGCEGFLKF